MSKMKIKKEKNDGRKCLKVIQIWVGSRGAAEECGVKYNDTYLNQWETSDCHCDSSSFFLPDLLPLQVLTWQTHSVT